MAKLKCGIFKLLYEKRIKNTVHFLHTQKFSAAHDLNTRPFPFFHLITKNEFVFYLCPLFFLAPVFSTAMS